MPPIFLALGYPIRASSLTARPLLAPLWR